MRRHPPIVASPAVLLATVSLILAACGDRRAAEDDTAATPADEVVAPADRAAPVATSPGPVDPGAPPAAGATAQSDALGMLIAANEHEIAAADQAIAKKVTGPVLAFAQMMKTDHGRNLEETRKLGAATEGAAVQDMRTQADAEMTALGAESGKAYEKAYVDAMVQGHTDVLAKLDSTLIPAATDAAVKAHFTATRAAVAHHLAEAKKLQTKP
jgi:putative membrane protein